MSVRIEEQNSAKVFNRRVHMANERTFLAWIRTGIGIMAFGFVVKKFGLFINTVNSLASSHGYTSVLGIGLVGLGTLMNLLAFLKYKKTQRQINEDTYQPSSVLDLLLTISVLGVGVLLVVYLIRGT